MRVGVGRGNGEWLDERVARLTGRGVNSGPGDADAPCPRRPGSRARAAAAAPPSEAAAAVRYAVLAMGMLDDADIVQGDRARPDQVADARQEPIDLLSCVDPFDDHWQVRPEGPQPPRRQAAGTPHTRRA